MTPITQVPSPSSGWDWVTSPTVLEKRANCGKLTLIIHYSNGYFEILVFRCHNWKCPYCANIRRFEIAEKIMSVSLFWYVTTVPDPRYTAIQKRITRAGIEYCAMQHNDDWAILTLEPVLEGGQLIAGDELALLTMQCCVGPHVPGQRMFRSSRGLFPVMKDSDVHIKRKIVVNEPFKDVLNKLMDDGHIFFPNNSGRYFGTPTGDFKTFLEHKEPGYFEVAWVEQPRAEQQPRESVLHNDVQITAI